jgi:phosphotransferase system enzyme I (PtsI)
MKTLTGIAASPGTAVAPAYVYQPDAYDIPTTPTGECDKSIDHLNQVLDDVAASLDAAAAMTTGTPREIVQANAAMARDPALRRSAEAHIRAGAHPARAIVSAGEEFARTLEHSGNEYIAARAPDVRHICELASRAIVGAPPRLPPRPRRPSIVVADDLMPADTAVLDPALVKGIVTSRGGRTSHTSVMAQALGVPAVVAVPGVVAEVSANDVVGMDGTTGEVVVNPDATTVRRLTLARRAYQQQRQRVHAAAGRGPAGTADGTRVEVAANITGLEELAAALREGAEGVGLLRTELLYLDRVRPPTQQEQADVLRAMHQALGDRRLVVRTFDLGTDKQVSFLPPRPERNPELGVRGLRLARVHPDLLQTQLRAIAETASLGPTAVMAPMVSTVDEARWFAAQVAAAGMPPGTEVGVMVEVPALALMADRLAPHVDFMSIGTNDLMQYLFAADRRDEKLAALQDPFSPAVLHAVAATCRGAGQAAWVGICGQAAAEPAWALLAVGLGVRELSMPAFAIARVRAALAKVTIAACHDAAERALVAGDAVAAREIAGTLTRRES